MSHMFPSRGNKSLSSPISKGRNLERGGGVVSGASRWPSRCPEAAVDSTSGNLSSIEGSIELGCCGRMANGRVVVSGGGGSSGGGKVP